MSRTDRPACDLVRRALNAVIASETFARSERLRSFLSYVVENELAGKAAHLKGYSIGIDVFGRPPGFEAGNDPLVRVQAGKLRKLLEQYYESEGAADGVRIRVPLGSYVPEYSVTERPKEIATETAAQELANAAPGARQKSGKHRSWIPAPVSSPLALFSLLPLFFLAPSVYPDTTNAAIAKAQLVLSEQNKFADSAESLPGLQILQCWPSGGECNTLARAISNYAGYHKTVRLVGAPGRGKPHRLSYSIRIENRADGRGVYARLMHDQSGATIYTRYFSREQLRSEAGIAYEAVTFAARTLSASGPIYRHAMRNGATSSLMECLTQAEHRAHRGTAHAGRPAVCTTQPGASLAKASILDETGATFTQ